ncbi:hypothetical protein AGMMS49925_02700 [Deltaproteobacteria bacterium]|nr:hypothetical protein AGMMS49925_02700 [Deltaproteobacteria bacterium]
MTLRPLLRFVWYSLPPVLRACLSVELFRLLLHRNKSGNAQAAGPTYVVGFFTAPTGLGQSARLYFQELRQHGRVVHAVDVTRLLPLASVQGLLPEGALPLLALNRYAGPGVVVIHANPPVFMFVLWAVRKFLPGKRVVAYWAWELEDIPAFWTRCLDWLDEVQVPSNFVANAVRKYTTKSVFVHPHAVLAVLRGRRSKEQPFTVLYCFDCCSNFARKNPLAVIAAFKEAFGDSPDAHLVLKASNVEVNQDAWRQLQAAVDAPNIRFCLGRLNEQGMADLYAGADVYISLHRSEGYGLTIQEAMLHGLPVIATGWSGNMDFMSYCHSRESGNPENISPCRAVPYTLVPVNDPQATYTMPGVRWAEPDVGAVAGILREIRKALK